MKCVCALQYFFVHNIFWGGVKYEAMCFWQDSRGAFASYTTLDLLIQSRFWLIWTLDSQSFQMCDDVHDVFLRQGRDGDMIESQHPLGLRSCDTNVRLVLMGDCVCVCVWDACAESRSLSVCTGSDSSSFAVTGEKLIQEQLEGFVEGHGVVFAQVVAAGGAGEDLCAKRPLQTRLENTNTTPLLTLQYITKSQL